MDVKGDIAARVDKLPPELQAEVLRFVTSLTAPTPGGESGAELRRFSGFLDTVSTQEITKAIEEHCEGVDASEW